MAVLWYGGLGSEATICKAHTWVRPFLAALRLGVGEKVAQHATAWPPQGTSHGLLGTRVSVFGEMARKSKGLRRGFACADYSQSPGLGYSPNPARDAT